MPSNDAVGGVGQSRHDSRSRISRAHRAGTAGHKEFCGSVLLQLLPSSPRRLYSTVCSAIRGASAGSLSYLARIRLGSGAPAVDRMWLGVGVRLLYLPVGSGRCYGAYSCG